MVSYIVGRLLRMIPQILIITILAFIIIQLPPGDFLTERINRLKASGLTVGHRRS
jgi:peptide/nickel transport system permease protein